MPEMVQKYEGEQSKNNAATALQKTELVSPRETYNPLLYIIGGFERMFLDNLENTV